MIILARKKVGSMSYGCGMSVEGRTVGSVSVSRSARHTLSSETRSASRSSTCDFMAIGMVSIPLAHRRMLVTSGLIVSGRGQRSNLIEGELLYWL